MYLILSAVVILVLIYQSISRRLASSTDDEVTPEAAPIRTRAASPKKETPAAAPKSPRSRTVKKTASPVEETVAAPVASPKARKSRKSTVPVSEPAEPIETESAAAPYVFRITSLPLHLLFKLTNHLYLQFTTQIFGS